KFQRPEHLARFKGHEQALYRILVQQAKVWKATPPSEQRMKQWVQAATSQRSTLPAAKALLGPRQKPGVTPAPFRPLVLDHRRGRQVVLQSRPSAPTKGGTTPRSGGKTEVVTGLLVDLRDRPIPFAIKPGDKTYTNVFVAEEPGLYRADLWLD